MLWFSNNYIVEVIKGNNILEKKRFKNFDGRDGAEIYVFMESWGKNLDNTYKFIIRRGKWFKEYDSNGKLVSLCGVDPVQIITSQALAKINDDVAQLVKKYKIKE